MLDQVIIGKRGSLDCFDASMKERFIIDGKKKTIKETVPFSNKVYDFTKINGEAYWKEKELKYVFEIVADTPEELSEKVKNFKAWVMNIQEENLYDPYIEKYHFVATFDDIEVDDSEIEKAVISVKFTAYPYMISNQKKTYQAYLENESIVDIVITNNSCHPVIAKFRTDVDCAIIDGDSDTFVRGSVDVFVNVGQSVLTVAGVTEQNGNIYLEFDEEVF